ncbi:MAG: hypothetical protein R3A48_13635 [Polyangiales bacterium]
MRGAAHTLTVVRRLLERGFITLPGASTATLTPPMTLTGAQSAAFARALGRSSTRPAGDEARGPVSLPKVASATSGARSTAGVDAPMEDFDRLAVALFAWQRARNRA